MQKETFQTPSFKNKKEKRKSWFGFESASEILEFHSSNDE
jgi:hypothetical protein